MGCGQGGSNPIATNCGNCGNTVEKLQKNCACAIRGGLAYAGSAVKGKWVRAVAAALTFRAAMVL